MQDAESNEAWVLRDRREREKLGKQAGKSGDSHVRIKKPEMASTRDLSIDMETGREFEEEEEVMDEVTEPLLSEIVSRNQEKTNEDLNLNAGDEQLEEDADSDLSMPTDGENYNGNNNPFKRKIKSQNEDKKSKNNESGKPSSGANASKESKENAEAPTNDGSRAYTSKNNAAVTLPVRKGAIPQSIDADGTADAEAIDSSKAQQPESPVNASVDGATSNNNNNADISGEDNNLVDEINCDAVVDENNNADRSASVTPNPERRTQRSPSPGKPQQQPMSNDQRIKLMEQKTDMITEKMKDNLDEIMKRDVALGDLEETAGGLAEGAKQFHQTSKKVNRKMWWRNHKWSFIIGCSVVVVLVGIGLAVAGSMGAFSSKR